MEIIAPTYVNVSHYFRKYDVVLYYAKNPELPIVCLRDVPAYCASLAVATAVSFYRCEMRDYQEVVCDVISDGVCFISKDIYKP